MPFYRAKFTIESEREDELELLEDHLAFAKNENAHQEGDWIQCVCVQTGRVGLLPLNYLIEEEPPSQIIYVAKADFQPQEKGDMALKKFDVVYELPDRNIDTDEWAKGVNERTLDIGVFPTANCTKEYRGRSKQRESPSSRRNYKRDGKDTKPEVSLLKSSSSQQVKVNKVVKQSSKGDDVVNNGNNNSQQLDYAKLVDQLSSVLTQRLNKEMDKRDQTLNEMQKEMKQLIDKVAGENHQQNENERDFSESNARTKDKDPNYNRFSNKASSRHVARDDEIEPSDRYMPTPPSEVLRINIVSAQNLKSDGFIMKSKGNPYVKIFVGEECVATTLPIEKSTNPVWNENFNLHVPYNSDWSGSTIVFKVFDADVKEEAKVHEFLGQVYLEGENIYKAFDRSEMARGDPLVEPLVDKDGNKSKKIKGTLSFRIRLVSSDRASDNIRSYGRYQGRRQTISRIERSRLNRSKSRGSSMVNQINAEREMKRQHRRFIHVNRKNHNHTTQPLGQEDLRLLRDQYYNGHAITKRSNAKVRLEDLKDEATKRALAKVKAWAQLPTHKTGRYPLKGFQPTGEHGSALLDAPELVKQFKLLHVKLTMKEAEALVNLWDTDGSQTVDFTEFLYNFHKWRKEGKRNENHDHDGKYSGKSIYFPSLNNKKVNDAEKEDRLSKFKKFRSNNRENTTCPICGEKGHFASECPMSSVQKREAERVASERAVRARYDRFHKMPRIHIKSSTVNHVAAWGGRKPRSQKKKRADRRRRDHYSYKSYIRAQQSKRNLRYDYRDEYVPERFQRAANMVQV